VFFVLGLRWASLAGCNAVGKVIFLFHFISLFCMIIYRRSHEMTWRETHTMGLGRGGGGDGLQDFVP
jgi:hypothetical protein